MAAVYRSGNHARARAYFIFRSAPLGVDHRDVGRYRRLLGEVFGGDASWRVPELLAGALAAGLAHGPPDRRRPVGPRPDRAAAGPPHGERRRAPAADRGAVR